MKPKTILLGDVLCQHEHIVGDETCRVGWCGGTGYPVRCECGGLIHAEFGDESYYGDYWLFTKCDQCGEWR